MKKMNKTTILVVDDEDISIKILKVMLEKLGYQVLAAESGEEALNVLGENSVDLVISDHHMSGMTGLELLQHIKKMDAHLPFIMLTAYGSIEKAVEAMKAGAIDYLTKPFQAETLRLVVDRTLKYSRLALEIQEQKQFFTSHYGFESIVTRSPLMHESIELAGKVAEIPNMAVAIYGGKRDRKRSFRPGNPLCCRMPCQAVYRRQLCRHSVVSSGKRAVWARKGCLYWCGKGPGRQI